MCNRNYVLIIMMFCTLEVCAADFDGLTEESVIFSDSMSLPHGGLVEDMDIVDGHCSSDEECDLEIDVANKRSDTGIHTDFPTFENYFSVGKLPYNNVNKDDALLWRARLTKGSEAIEVQRIVGARAFIDVLKERYQDYNSEPIQKVIAGVGREYAECDDDEIYNNRLDQIEQVINIDWSYEMGLCYAKPEDHDCLGCPLLVRKIITSIRNNPRKTQYTNAEFNEWVQKRVHHCKLEGSYVVSANSEAIKEFVEKMRVFGGDIPSTGWQLVQIDE